MPRRCKNWLQAYCDYASFTEAPSKFHFWTGVSVLAGAIRRRAWIDMKAFQWTPNFYIVFVGPPGTVQKSTTAGLGMNLLKRIDEINFGPDSATWQSLVEYMGENGEEMTIGKKTYPMSPVTILASEFGTFFDPTNREMVDTLVRLWDGQKEEYKKITKTSGTDIITNPWINILACTTPSWIATTFSEYMVGGGFTARTIFVYADSKSKDVPYPDETAHKDHSLREAKLTDDLRDIIEHCKGPIVIPESSRVWGRAWYTKFSKECLQVMAADTFRAYYARKWTHLHKLAMILSIASGNTMSLEVEHYEAADKILSANEIDMPKVFQNMGSAHSQLCIV